MEMKRDIYTFYTNFWGNNKIKLFSNTDKSRFRIVIMNGANMFRVNLRKTWLDLGRYFGSLFLLSCPLQREHEQWIGNFCSFSYRHINSRYSTTVWRRILVITWPRYRKIACALCTLLKKQKQKRFQSLSIVVAFFSCSHHEPDSTFSYCIPVRCDEKWFAF